MPYLNIGNDWPFFDRFEVLGVMFFPQDEDRREQIITIMRAKIYLALVDNNKEIISDEESKDALINDLLNLVNT